MEYREFLNECSDIKNNVLRRKYSLDNLREAELKYTSAASVPFYISPGTGYSGDRMIDRLDLIEKRKNEADRYHLKIEVILDIIDEIPLKSIRYFVWRTYIDCIPCTVIAKWLDMNPSYLRQVLRDNVQQAIKECGGSEMTEMTELLEYLES